MYSEANIYLAADDCVGIPGVMPCVDENPCAVNNDWFVDRSLAVVSRGDDRGDGHVKSVGDLLLNEAHVATRQPDKVFDPADSYSFSAEPATEALAATIKAQVGPRTSWSE